MKTNSFFLTVLILMFLISCGSNTDTGTSNSGDLDDEDNTDTTADSDSIALDTDADFEEINKICPEDNKFCHPHDGLSWSDVSVDYNIIWDDAVIYCENLGGRLPTISELRTLIQNCPATEPDGSCGVDDDCLSAEKCWSELCRDCNYDSENPHKYSVFGDQGYLWSSSKLSDNEYLAWLAGFDFGNIHHYDSADGMGSVRCLGIAE